MDSFPFPAEPTPQQDAFQASILRGVAVALPFVILVKVLLLLVIGAVLISYNFNVLGWIE